MHSLHLRQELLSTAGITVELDNFEFGRILEKTSNVRVHGRFEIKFLTRINKRVSAIDKLSIIFLFLKLFIVDFDAF